MSRHAFTLSAALIATGSLLSEPSEARRAGPAAVTRDFETEVLPYLRQHCFRCHGERRAHGDLRLDELSHDFVAGHSLSRWLEVLERINGGEMPPPDQPDRPDAEESARVVAWIASRIREGEESRLARRERVSFHRLTREEYAHTIADLVGVDFDPHDPAGLNADEQWHGIERIGSVLSLSRSHLEKAMAAAEAILDEAWPDAPPEPILVRRRAPDLVRAAASDREEEIRVDLWPGQRVRTGRSVAAIEQSGRYRFRIQASGLKFQGGRAPHLVVQAESIDRLLFERDLLAPEGAPVVVEFEAHLPAGDHEFSLTNEVPGPPLLAQLRRSPDRPFFSLEEGHIPWQVALKDDDDLPLQPLLILDWIEWSGPLPNDRLRDDRDLAAPGDLAQISANLERFAERAFRRPLRDGELAPLIRLASRELEDGAPPLTAMKTAMLAVLCSNDFLYLVEGSADRTDNALHDGELASRLSYFLWSTMPDRELFELARSGRLGEPEVLAAQLRRMLSDPRAGRLAESFAPQWLRLDQVGRFPPDAELYPEYDGPLERSMIRESTEFFAEVLRENLSLGEFIVSDWTMLDARLALHYGIPGITEDRFQRVSLDPRHHRGGLLTHASILSLTSDGTRHRPVHRGVWIAESILGEFPPPPPASVEPIEPTPVDAPKSTVRQQIEAHRSDANCAACHRRIDPLGLAFDHYDAIGRWRREEVVPTGVGANPEVDASGSLPDGRSFGDHTGLQQFLLDDLDVFAEAFVRKLASFALRRAMTVDDRAAIARITAGSRARGHRLRDLLEGLVLSDLFRKR